MSLGYGSAPFLTQVPGCLFWTDAMDISANGTAPSNGSAVGTWVDKSIGGNNLLQATGVSQGVYSATGLSGKPGISFDGSGNKFMATAGNVFITNACSIFIVAQANTVAGTNIMLSTGGAGNTALTTGNVASKFQGTYETATVVNTANSAIASYTVPTIYNMTVGAFFITLLRNNAADATQSILGVRSNTSHAIYLNSLDTSGTTASTIYGEIAIFGQDLDAFTRLDVMRYFSNKWGIF